MIDLSKIQIDSEFLLRLLQEQKIDIHSLPEEELAVVRSALNELTASGTGSYK